MSDKKRKGGSAAKYAPEKRQLQNDPRRTKLHVNEPKSLRGFAMVLATYDGHEGKATIDLHRSVAPFIEAIESSQNSAAEQEDEEAKNRVSSSSCLTASDLLEQELQELGEGEGEGSAKQKSIKVATVRTNCKGVMMLRIGSKCQDEAVGPSLDVVTLVNDIFSSVKLSGSCSRHVVKVVPLQRTCFAGLDEIAEQVKLLLAAHFRQPCSYKVALKRRNNCKFDKDGMVSRIVDLVGPSHRVDLQQPEKVIIVEVIQSLAGVSVSEQGRFTEYLEYNLRKYQEALGTQELKKGQGETTEPPDAAAE